MNLEWVKVPAGGPVKYDYWIMKYPVTNEVYCEWLNALPNVEAAKHYCPLMAVHFFGGIEVSGEGASRRYQSKTDFSKKPVVFVSYDDAEAFAMVVGGRIPTAVEWNKAAAWLPAENRFAGYCTGFDAPPSQDPEDSNSANFYDSEKGWALPIPHLADVDLYPVCGSYRLCGMAGNVAEWVDATMPNGWKCTFGGSLFRPVGQTLLHSMEGDRRDKRLSTFGFRVVKTDA